MMVTWHQLACVVGILVGLVLTGFGLLATFAAMMADTSGDEAWGCLPLLIGLAVLAVSIAGIWL